MFSPPSPEQIRGWYPGYDSPVFVHNLQAHLIGEVVDPLIEQYLPEGGVAVDLGCGSGTMVKQLSARAATAIGVDVDRGSFAKHTDLTIVDDDARDIDRLPGALLAQRSIYDVPVGDATVDFVTSRWVFEHIADPAAALREIFRILKPGGVALLVVPNRLHPGVFLSSLMPLRLKQIFLRSSSGVEEDLVMPTFYRINTERDLDRQFAAARFERLELHQVRDPSYWLFSRALFRVATLAGEAAERLPLRRFRMHLIGVYRKPQDEERVSSPG